MTTPLSLVRDLNYDHHRRMTALHEASIANGTNKGISETDDLSYRTLLACVPKDRSCILELGSASGGQWDLLREWSSTDKIHGIDLYEPFVTKAREAGKAVEVGFVENMRMYPNETFDLVCSRHVMEHLGDVDRGISEILRVSKSHGYIAHVTPDMAFDNEPSHLNKWNRARWTAKWVEHGVKILYSKRHDFHGGEVHVVGQKA